jgi:hypothetical protein
VTGAADVAIQLHHHEVVAIRPLIGCPRYSGQATTPSVPGPA